MKHLVSPIYSWAETGLSVVGAGIAGTLWWAHRQNIELPCMSGGGCGEVSSSAWSHLSFGPSHSIPVALLGFITYLVLLTLSMAKIGAETERSLSVLLVLMLLLSGAATAFSWYLQFVAHFLIGAFCAWCFSSAVTMTALFFVGMWELKTMRSAKSV